MSLQVHTGTRVVIDNDWAGDPDGLLALAHHVLSPGNEIVAVTSSLLHPMFGPTEGGAERGRALADELLGMLDLRVPCCRGADTVFTMSDRPSDAADAIVAAARHDGQMPLTIVCAGPLTNVADAVYRAPEVAGRIKLVWVGGSLRDDFEYNREVDARAESFIMGHPDIEITRFPVETYRQCVCSLAELEMCLAQGGLIGRWLWNQFDSLEVPDFIELGDCWVLGDSVPLLVTALPSHTCVFRESVGSSLRDATEIDVRLLLSDMRAKLWRHGERELPRRSSRPAQ